MALCFLVDFGDQCKPVCRREQGCVVLVHCVRKEIQCSVTDVMYGFCRRKAQPETFLAEKQTNLVKCRAIVHRASEGADVLLFFVYR